MFCPVRCSLKEIPSKGVTKIKFKRLKIIGVKSFNRLNILKLIIIKSNVINHQSKSRYRHHHWGRPRNRTENRTEQFSFCSCSLGINSRLGNQFPDFGLRDFFWLNRLCCHVVWGRPRDRTRNRTEQNHFCSWFLGINSRLVDLEFFLSGNEFPFGGLRWFFDLSEGGHGTEQRTEQNNYLLFLFSGNQFTFGESIPGFRTRVDVTVI